MNKAWLFLFLAGLFEIGWPLGFKLSTIGNNRLWWIIFACISMALSGYFLWFAQKTIPIGTAYAVWTGIGASGTFLIGILLFKDPYSMLRILSFLLIITGLIGLKISS